MNKDTLAGQHSREVVVGFFMVMVFLGLAYFTIILSREVWFSKKYDMEVVFRHVMGLRDGDNVVVRGMPIGKVKALKLENAGVKVLVSLDQPLSMRNDYRIDIVSTSILGGRYLEIHEGSSDHPVIPADTLLRGHDPYDLMADLAEVANSLRKALNEGGVLDNVKTFAEQVKMLSTRVSEGKSTLGRLLSEDDTLYKDLAASVASFREVAGRLERGESTLGRLLAKDGKMYDDLSTTVTSLKDIATRVEKGEGTLGRLLSKDDQLYRDVSEAVASLKNVAQRLEKGDGVIGQLLAPDNTLYADLTNTVASLRGVAEGLRKGEGTLGKLLKDEAVYQELQGVLRETRAAVDDFRETSPVLTFTSVFFGAF